MKQKICHNETIEKQITRKSDDFFFSEKSWTQMTFIEFELRLQIFYKRYFLDKT